MYTSSVIEYLHSFNSQTDADRQCVLLPLHDRDFLQPLEFRHFPPSLSGIIVCHRGSLCISDGQSDRRLEAMSVLPITPWQNITLHSSEDFSADIILFTSNCINNGLVQTDCVCDLLLHLLRHLTVPLADDEYGVLKKTLRVVGQLYRMQGESNSITFAIQHTLAVVLYIIHDSVIRHKQVKSISFQNRQCELFAEFFRLLTNNYRRERSVAYYAEQIRLTPSYLSRVTKEVSGRSAAEWIDYFVIAEMKYLLRYTNRSVQQIAYDMNFPNQSFFGKYFKNHAGCSPTTYRLSHKW